MGQARSRNIESNIYGKQTVRISLVRIICISAFLIFSANAYAQSFPCPTGTFPLVISAWKNDSGNLFGWGPAVGARIKLSSASSAPVATTSNGSNGLNAGVTYFCLAPGQPYSLRTMDPGRELVRRTESPSPITGTGQAGTMSVLVNYMFATYSVTLEATTEGGQGAPIEAVALANQGCGCSTLDCGQRVDRPISQVALPNGKVRFDNVPYGNARFYAQSSDPNFSITQAYIDKYVSSNASITFTAISNFGPTATPTFTPTPTRTATRTPSPAAPFTPSATVSPSKTPTRTPTGAATYTPTLVATNTPTGTPSSVPTLTATTIPSPEGITPTTVPPLSSPSPTATAPPAVAVLVEPFVACVSAQDSGLATTVFGYRNFSDEIINLDSMGTSRILERPEISPPSRLHPGIHYSAIELAFGEAESQLTWRIGANLATAHRAEPCGACNLQLPAPSRALQAVSLKIYRRILNRLKAAASKQFSLGGMSQATLEANRLDALQSHRRILHILDLSSRPQNSCLQFLACSQTSISARAEIRTLFNQQLKLLKFLTRSFTGNKAGANRVSYPKSVLRRLPSQVIDCFSP